MKREDGMGPLYYVIVECTNSSNVIIIRKNQTHFQAATIAKDENHYITEYNPSIDLLYLYLLVLLGTQAEDTLSLPHTL